ncbi:MAG: hypothetical protein DMG59_28845, partial [Acidobacteria bacterium]
MHTLEWHALIDSNNDEWRNLEELGRLLVHLGRRDHAGLNLGRTGREGVLSAFAVIAWRPSRNVSQENGLRMLARFWRIEIVSLCASSFPEASSTAMACWR